MTALHNECKAPPISPTMDRVLVRRLTDTMTKGGIILPANRPDRGMIRAVVVAVGPGKRHFCPTPIPCSDYDTDTGETSFGFASDCPLLEVGQTIIFPAHSGFDVEYDGEKYLLLREEECYAVIEGDD